MGKNKYYCKINGVIHNLSDIEQAIQDDPDSNSVILRLMENHNFDIQEAILFYGVLDFNNYEIPADYNECLERMKARNRARNDQIEASKVHCPYCKSTNVKKIGVSRRLVSTATFGLAGKVGKQWHCNNCKSDF